VVFEDNQNRLKRRFVVAKLYYGLTDTREIRLQTEYLTPCVVTCHKRSRSLVVWLRETILEAFSLLFDCIHYLPSITFCVEPLKEVLSWYVFIEDPKNIRVVFSRLLSSRWLLSSANSENFSL